MAREIGTDGDPMPREEPHNYLDNAASYRDLFPVNALYRDFSLASTQVLPFATGEQAQTKLMYCMAAGYGMGRCYLEGDGNTATVDKSLVIPIGEILAPGLPNHLWLDTGSSRAKLVRVVRKIMATPQAFFFFAIPTDGFVQRFTAKYHIEQRFGIPVGSEDWMAIDMNRGQAMKLLAAFGDAISTQSQVLAQKMFVTMLIAALKKGSVTDPFVQKIMTGCLK